MHQVLEDSEEATIDAYLIGKVYARRPNKHKHMWMGYWNSSEYSVLSTQYPSPTIIRCTRILPTQYTSRRWGYRFITSDISKRESPPHHSETRTNYAVSKCPCPYENVYTITEYLCVRIRLVHSHTFLTLHTTHRKCLSTLLFIGKVCCV